MRMQQFVSFMKVPIQSRSKVPIVVYCIEDQQLMIDECNNLDNKEEMAHKRTSKIYAQIQGLHKK